MRKSISTLALFLSLVTLSFAQMKEGKINYEMNFTSDNPDMAMAIGMMQGSTMSLHFMPGKARADVSMGAMGTMSTITDQKSKKSLTLMNMMGMKYAMEAPIEEPDNSSKEKPDVKITNETKDILGYKCTKAIMTVDTEDGEKPMEMWFTKDINVYTGGQNYYSPDMPGFPMEFLVSANGMDVNMKVTSIEKKVDKKSFDMKIPEGYEVKSMDEFMMEGGE